MPKNKGVPDGWLDYTKVGTKIEGTNFIAFKVPLNDRLNNLVKPTYEQFNQAELLEKLPDLGLIIDLTDTNRYYKPDFFQQRGVKYVKIMVPGHQIPIKKYRKQFCDEVKQFLDQNPSSKKLVGVHCTHGVNRTGFLICNFMIDEMNIEPGEALKRFGDARGHKIRRENYIKYLMNLENNMTYNSGVRNTEDVTEPSMDSFSLNTKRKVKNDFSSRLHSDVWGTMRETTRNSVILKPSYFDRVMGRPANYPPIRENFNSEGGFVNKRMRNEFSRYDNQEEYGSIENVVGSSRYSRIRENFDSEGGLINSRMRNEFSRYGNHEDYGSIENVDNSRYPRIRKNFDSEGDFVNSRMRNEFSRYGNQEDYGSIKNVVDNSRYRRIRKNFDSEDGFVNSRKRSQFSRHGNQEDYSSIQNVIDNSRYPRIRKNFDSEDGLVNSRMRNEFSRYGNQEDYGSIENVDNSRYTRIRENFDSERGSVNNRMRNEFQRYDNQKDYGSTDSYYNRVKKRKTVQQNTRDQRYN